MIEHEWQLAVDTALSIEQRAGEDRSVEIAHYNCELAEGALQAKNFGLAKEYVERALERDEATPASTSRRGASPPPWASATRRLPLAPRDERHP